MDSTSIQPSQDPVGSFADSKSAPSWADPLRLRRRVIRGGSFLIVTRIGTQVLSWAGTLFVARLLRPYDYGVMTTGMIFIALADVLAEAGVSRALVQKERLEPRDLAEGFTLSLILSVALCALLIAVAPSAGAFLDDPDLPALLRLLALSLILTPFRAIPMALLERNLELRRQSAAYALSLLFPLCLVLGLAVRGYGFWALAGGTLATRALEAVMLPYLAGWRPQIVKPGRHARELLKFGVHVSLGALLWFAYSNADYAVVSKVIGPAALGYYALAFQLISLPVQKLTGNVNQAVYPLYCRLQHDRDRLRDWYLRVTALLSLLGMPVLAGMAIVADDAFALLLGEKWLPAVVPFQVLAFVGMLMTVSYSLSPLINALGRPDINLRYTIISTIILPSGFVILGLTHGLVGICWAWLILYPLIDVWIVHSTRHLTGCSVKDLAVAQLPVVMGVIAMAVTTLMAKKLLADVSPAVLRLGATIAVGAATYTGFMLLVARRTVVADLRMLLRELRRDEPEPT